MYVLSLPQGKCWKLNLFMKAPRYSCWHVFCLWGLHSCCWIHTTLRRKLIYFSDSVLKHCLYKSLLFILYSSLRATHIQYIFSHSFHPQAIHTNIFINFSSILSSTVKNNSSWNRRQLIWQSSYCTHMRTWVLTGTVI